MFFITLMLRRGIVDGVLMRPRTPKSRSDSAASNHPLLLDSGLVAKPTTKLGRRNTTQRIDSVDEEFSIKGFDASDNGAVTKHVFAPFLYFVGTF